MREAEPDGVRLAFSRLLERFDLKPAAIGCGHALDLFPGAVRGVAFDKNDLRGTAEFGESQHGIFDVAAFVPCRNHARDPGGQLRHHGTKRHDVGQGVQTEQRNDREHSVDESPHSKQPPREVAAEPLANHRKTAQARQVFKVHPRNKRSR